MQTRPADNRPSTSFPAATEIPYQYSRSKALNLLENKSDATGREESGKASADAVNKMYEMYLKIGATNELPEKEEHIESYLSDFWRTIYLHNNMVPPDMPFDVIIDEFAGKLVRGEIDRKGNNQAALCQAFNKWVTYTETRNRLYELRDRKYPSDKPKQLQEGSGYASSQEEADMNRMIKGKKVHEWPDSVIVSQYKLLTETIFPGDDGKKLIENFGASAYTHKIISEAQKRELV